MMARLAADDMVAAATSLNSPRLIAGISMVPSAATSATAEPEISAKNTEVPIATIDNPPRDEADQRRWNAISRREIDEAFMIAPDRMNSGIASNGKLGPRCTLPAPDWAACAALDHHDRDHGDDPERDRDRHVEQASASMPTSMRPMVIV